MIKNRSVLIIKCDDPTCTIAARFEGDDRAKAKAAAVAAGWVIAWAGCQYCRNHNPRLAEEWVDIEPGDGEVALDLQCDGVKFAGRRCGKTAMFSGRDQATATAAAEAAGWVIDDQYHVFCKDCATPIPAWARPED